MGVRFSCPLAECSDAENAFESVVVKSISFGDDEEANTPLRSVSFGSRDMEPTILKSSGTGKMIVERSVSFKRSELGRLISSGLLEKEKDASLLSVSMDRLEMDGQSPTAEKLPMSDPSNSKHQAAIKLQKVYKSFRTRRKLADCAVLVEQSWWKLLDFAELKHSSISFFDIEKHESAISRWSRARTRAAKVGKGLSKNDKAQKLALQHWLEAIDPRHRYGHNLRFYYVQWLHSKSREPFFYWLDIGEGKEVNLEMCPRSKLQQQCIKYLGPMERKAYEVVIEDEKFIYQQSGELLQTTEDAKWIFVLSTSKTMYVGKKKKGTFQHSSFLAGGVTLAAGQIIVESGILKAVWPHSGHYRPTEENFKDFLSFLRENNVDLANVKTSPMDDDESSISSQRGSKHIRSNSSEEDLIHQINDLITKETSIEDLAHASIHSVEEETSASAASTNSRSEHFHNFGRTLTTLEIPKRDELLERVESNPIVGLGAKDVVVNPPADNGYESAEGKQNEVQGIPVPEEEIFERISSKRRTKSYQLGKQLSCKWTTGAGPRIGCVRDYPWELQFRALEQVNLSPRSIDRLNRTCALSRRSSTPTGFCAGEAVVTSSPMLARQCVMGRISSN